MYIFKLINYQVVAQVVTYVHLLHLICQFLTFPIIFNNFHYLSILVLALNKDILKEVVIMLLERNKYN